MCLYCMILFLFRYRITKLLDDTISEEILICLFDYRWIAIFRDSPFSGHIHELEVPQHVLDDVIQEDSELHVIASHLANEPDGYVNVSSSLKGEMGK